MRSGSRSGDSIHWRNRRPPIGVTVRSMISRSVTPLAPARSGSTSSRLRRVISSSQQSSSLRRTCGRPRCGSPCGWSSTIYRSNAPAAPMHGESSGARPRPSSDASLSRRASSSEARSTSNSQRSRCVRITPSSVGRSASTGRTTSAGERRLSASGRLSRGTVSRVNSPVDRSMAASPTPVACGSNATSQLLREPGVQSSSRNAPGVTVSVTARLTMPLAARGSSICSQMATRNPCATNRRRYPAAAFTGTPASGTPSPRDVSVMFSARAAVWASS